VRRKILYNIFIEFGELMKLVRLIRMCLNICVRFSIQSGLKQRRFITLLFNCAVEYAIRKAQESQVGLKLNGTLLLLAYADDVNVLRTNIDTVKKNKETLTDVGKEVGLEINLEKTKYISSLECRSELAHKNSEQIV
jgi:hypothetical protein